jgi:hypothetical protein
LGREIGTVIGDGVELTRFYGRSKGYNTITLEVFDAKAGQGILAAGTIRRREIKNEIIATT